MNDRTIAIIFLATAWFMNILAIRAILNHDIPWAFTDCGTAMPLLFLTFIFNRTQPVREDG